MGALPLPPTAQAALKWNEPAARTPPQAELLRCTSARRYRAGPTRSPWATTPRTPNASSIQRPLHTDGKYEAPEAAQTGEKTIAVDCDRLRPGRMHVRRITGRELVGPT